MASWRPLGTSWAAVGRQLAAKTALEVGAVLATLGPLLAAPGGHFGAFFDGPAPEAAISMILEGFFGQGLGIDFRLLSACVARVRRSSQQPKIMKYHEFLWVASHSRVFRGHRTGQEI